MPNQQWASHLNNTDTLETGWISQPESRGTMDILWACSSTLFICVWVMLHLNIPARDDSFLIVVVRKLKWFVMSMLAPELVMLFAGGQWAAACRSVSDMNELGINHWTMVHALYAESGGFELHTEDMVPFPITAKQLLYLLKHGYVDLPKITKAEIWDKSKADRFVKTLAALQSAWFTLEVTARAIQGLAITLLELSTLCLMTCTAATLYFWFHKPLDVRVPSNVVAKVSMAQILKEGGEDGKKPYKDTPLDFAEPLAYTSAQFPLNKFWGEPRRPLPRVPNDRDSLLHSWSVVLAISIPTAAFGTLQLLAWNFKFPTREEQMLWRYTTVGNGIVLGIGCVLEAGAIIASNYTLTGLRTFNHYKTRWPYCLAFFIPGSLYLVARVITIVEVMISLRALPSTCFQTVKWTNFIPHLS
ncbi:hypothetical protein CAC42_187 [Sphaceloma murrayae]|uniref:Uncharacterized protein n=1 Tax=Sphaceloma murrayae TaxID=2082308 RepID=A0A2K1QNM6_9PEZI|nr:hypothetical protein CAC42_187 [Sphaceloma murrayae]